MYRQCDIGVMITWWREEFLAHQIRISDILSLLRNSYLTHAVTCALFILVVLELTCALFILVVLELTCALLILVVLELTCIIVN